MDHNSLARGMNLNRLAISATVHCLTGCAIGEIIGMAAGTAAGWGTWTTVVVSVVLAFIFGYSFTLVPLVRSGFPLRTSLGLAFASDTASIAIMEAIDNAFMMVIPGAMDAGPATALFWATMVASLLLAGAAAFPVNRWLIAKGKGHAVIHATHGTRDSHTHEGTHHTHGH